MTHSSNMFYLYRPFLVGENEGDDSRFGGVDERLKSGGGINWQTGASLPKMAESHLQVIILLASLPRLYKWHSRCRHVGSFASCFLEA